jgi:thymidylate synthase (FAD)
MELLSGGASPQEARSVLPNSLKTEIVMTCNVREWRHVLDLRCSKAAHPQMREIMLPILTEFHSRAPILFEDLYQEYLSDIKALKSPG